jgi:flagellar basal-body rod modification protein FlgD
MAGLVGRTVLASADSITVDAQGGQPALRAHLDGPASKLSVDLVDGSGKPVRTLNLGPQVGGDVPIDWTQSGGALPPGTYGVQIHATAADGSAVNATPQIHGVIQSLDFASGAAQFRVGATDISPASIVSIES